MAKVMTRPCPNCKHPLAIPQPMPERFMCPKCGAVMKRKSSPAQPKTPVQAVGPGPPPRALTPTAPVMAPVMAPVAAGPAGLTPRKQLLILGGFLVVLLGGIFVVSMMLFTGNRSPRPGVDSAGGGTTPNNPNKPVKPADAARPGPGARVDQKQLEIVRPNIDRGLAFLVKQVAGKRAEEKKNGKLVFWGADWERGEGLAAKPWGVVALLGLTLLECGVPADNPDIAWLAENIDKNSGDLKQTHATAAAVMFLCRWHESKALDEPYRRLLRSLALRIIAGQLDYGGWWRELPVLSADQEKQLSKELKDGTFKPSQQGPGAASYTNFAIEALWGARRHDVPVRRSLIAAAGHFQRTQRDDGSWAFSDDVNDRFFATAACTGLIALAMEKAILDKDARPFIPSEKTADPTRAFAFLARSIGTTGDKATFEDRDMIAGKLFMADSWGDVYFLWALERVAVIYDMQTIDGKDWYDWGFKALLPAQNPEDGSWNDRHGPLADTCFALLFLKKSNFTRDLTLQLRELMGRSGEG